MQRLVAIAAVAASCGACGPTILVQESVVYSEVARAGLDFRAVQNDPFNTYTSHELWGYNDGLYPVCVGYKSLSWRSWRLEPGTIAKRLADLGNGVRSVHGAVMPLAPGDVCSDALLAQRFPG